MSDTAYTRAPLEPSGPLVLRSDLKGSPQALIAHCLETATTSREEARANACLFAAAPKMLAALQAQEAVDDHVAQCPDCTDETFPELCEAGFPLADEARLLRLRRFAGIETGIEYGREGSHERR